MFLAFLLLIEVLQSHSSPQIFGFSGHYPVPYSYPAYNQQESFYDSNPTPPSTGTCGDLWFYQTDGFGDQIGIIKIKYPHWQNSYIQVSLTVAAQLHQVSDSNFEQIADNFCELLNF